MWKCLLSLLVVVQAVAQGSTQGLSVRFGDHGLTSLSYKGVMLEDTGRWPSDEFHIWHMKAFDVAGHPMTTGQYGWGENNRGKNWDKVRQTWTYRFDWGSIETHYVVRGDSLNVEVTTVNRAGSGISFDGATMSLLTLHLPSSAASKLNDNEVGPGIELVDWGTGEAAVVVSDPDRPLFSGFEAGKQNASEIIASGTRPESLAQIPASHGRVVKSGETDHYTVSIRFAPSGLPGSILASDALTAWKRRWPETLRWKDRRIIGTVYLASSPQGDKSRPGGYQHNPRRYFNDPALSVTESLTAFQARVLQQAASIVENLRRLKAQGVITWDIEGEEYPQDTSYVCAPDQIGVLSPEMESLVRRGPYAGQKLDDSYFKIIRDAGFRIGVCVRPQRFKLGADGSAAQEYVDDTDASTEMIRKMRFAHDRWGATIFYLDSTVRQDGSVLPANMIDQVAAALPDSLIIPEESSPRMYRSSAPFKTFIFHGDVGTSDEVRALYPDGFSVNLINDVEPVKLEQHYKELVEAVRHGDVLMVHADSWQENNSRVMAIYREARSKDE